MAIELQEVMCVIALLKHLIASERLQHFLPHSHQLRRPYVLYGEAVGLQRSH